MDDIQDNIGNLFSLSRPKNISNMHDKNENVMLLDDAPEDTKILIKPLSYKVIETDMILLGCIRSIKTLSLEIELPGYTNGILLIKSISDEFTKNLNKAIDTERDVENELNLPKNIFKVGQYLPVKVLEKKQTDNGIKLILSTKPSDINSNKVHKHFQSKSLMWASVVEKGDHCYVLNSGVKNCRIVLPFKNVEIEKNYAIGEPLWCVIKNCEITNQASTITVSTLHDDLLNQMETSYSNLNNLLPGTKVNFTINKVTKFGLQGNIFDGCISCVPDMFFTKPYSNTKFKENQTLKAQLIYIEPITNFIYLSLRIMTDVKKPDLQIGNIVKSTVLCRSSNGIIINIPKPSEGRGLITYKRLSKAIKAESANFQNVLNTKFKINTTHKCRILDYNHMHNIYICTIEADVSKEKYFTLRDIEVGQRIIGKINDITDSGIVVKLGNLEGFITNLHLSNVEYTPNIKKKFKINQAVTMKVLQIQENRLLLTMKQNLLESDNCLNNLEKVDKTKQYPGVIVQKTKKDVTVLFYNGITGFLKKKELPDQNVDIEKFYYIGQVVLVYVKTFKKNKLLLSVQHKPIARLNKINLGQIVNGVVINCIDNESLVLEIENCNITANLPLTHLSSNIEYSKYLKEKYQIGDEIKGLICVSNKAENCIVSLREMEHFANKKLPKLHNLKPGQLLRCSYSHVDDDGFVFTSLIIFSDYKIIVPITEITDNLEDVKHLKFLPHQLVIIKIHSISEITKQIRGSAKLSEVSNYDYEESLELLGKYFENVEACKKDLMKTKNPILDYSEGDLVIGHIQYIGSRGGCIVKLPNGVKGIVHWMHAKKKEFKEGNLVECVVLYVDYIEGYVDLSMNKKYSTKSKNKTAELSEDSEHTLFGTVLLVKEAFVQCIVTKDNMKEFIYLPTHLHINDFIFLSEKYQTKIHEKIKLYVLRCINNRNIGISKQCMNSIEICQRKQKEIKYKVQQLKHKFITENYRSPKKRKINDQEWSEGETESDSLSENDSKESVEEETPENLDAMIISEEEREQRNLISNNSESTQTHEENVSETNEITLRNNDKSCHLHALSLNLRDTYENLEKKNKFQKNELISSGNSKKQQTLESGGNNGSHIAIDSTESTDITNNNSKKDELNLSTADVAENGTVALQNHQSKNKEQHTKEDNFSKADTNSTDIENKINKLKENKNKENLLQRNLKQDLKKTKNMKEKVEKCESTNKNKDSNEDMSFCGDNNDENILSKIGRTKENTSPEAKRKENMLENNKEVHNKSKQDIKNVSNTESDNMEKEDTINEQKEKKITLAKSSNKQEKVKVNGNQNTTKKRPLEKDEHHPTKKSKVTNDLSNQSQLLNDSMVLPGVNNFFLDHSLNTILVESSASEDEEEEKGKEKKKRKLSAKETADVIRIEEERLRGIETRLADSKALPATADEFDRLLLAEPDNSLLWTRYIAYYVESTEIDKAKAVARKALQRINPTKEQDRLNIWITFLNLENTYGTQESFDKSFEEAARCNDDFKIYTIAIDILGAAQKYVEMDKKIKKCKAKFSQIPQMWIKIGECLYKHNRITEARKLKDNMLTSLQNKSAHLQILIHFAKCEFEYGEKGHAEAMFEAILLSFPSRSDLWIKYTDQLIKIKDFDLARKVFTRAVAQKLNMKRMKILVKAFLAFETKYGKNEDIAKVKDIAKEYIKLQT